MKLLLTGDLQFSEQVNLSRRTEHGTTTRLEDQVACFDWLVSVGVKEGCEALLVLGDLFDSRTSIPVPVLDRVGRCFAKAKESFEFVLALVGNHDAALRHARLNSLQSLSGLVTVVSEPRVCVEEPALRELAFVPWVEDDDEFRMTVGTVAKVKSARFLFAHTLVEGAVPAEVGRAKADLRPSRWERIFLGDVHDPIEISSKIQYVGAPMQHHYGDAGGERGVWVFDTATGKARFVLNPSSPRFHLVTSKRDIGAIGERDFVRIQVEDVDEAREFAALAGKRATWVENNAVSLLSADAPPRLAVSSADPYRTILKRFVEHKKATSTATALVDVGLELLEEAL